MHAQIAARRARIATCSFLLTVVGLLGLASTGVASPELDGVVKTAPAADWSRQVADMPMPNLKARLSASAKAPRPANLDGQGAAARRAANGYLARAAR